MEDFDAEAFRSVRDQRLGRDQAHPGTHGRQQVNVRAGDPGMENVAADGDLQPGQAAEPAANGQGIKKGLRRMFVAAVTGVDDRAVDLFRQ